MLPFRINRDDPHWIPPLLMNVRALMNRKHPFHEHADVEFFLARDREGTVRGRISAAVNHAHNKYHNEKTGFFGFLDCENDSETAEQLLHTAEEWVKSRGMKRIRGPFNLSTNEECGLLVDGFDTDAKLMMLHNPQWLGGLVEQAGYSKLIDMLAYWVDGDETDFKRLFRIADMVEKRGNWTIRNINLNELPSEMRKIMDVYNECWSDNWGFVPMTSREFKSMVDELKMLIIDKLVPIIELEGEVVAFGVALPDANVAFRKGRGRAIPTILALKVPPFKQKIDRVRMLLMGTKKKHRNKGLEALVIREIVNNSKILGMGRGELSWILDSNREMRAIMEKQLKADAYKTYRIYEKEF
ncbi:N-acetyltransferase [Candidatus Fermentibacteria bacterium]|nr:MAG: N-acetyltransferase [Candidatus Fermentibacteria bacterium]